MNDADNSDDASTAAKHAPAVRWARIARVAAIGALALGLAAGLLPLNDAWGVAVLTLAATGTAVLAFAAAAILMAMRPRLRMRLTAAGAPDIRRHRAAMTTATVVALAALAMIWLANQRLIEHVRANDEGPKANDESNSSNQ